MSVTLFITAHPDDLETMLAYAALDSQGKKIAVVASDGTASHKNYTDEPDFCRAGKRQQESKHGLAQLEFAHQHYLELPDGKLRECQDAMAAQILTIARTHAVTQVISLGEAGYDGHPDHIATHYAAAQVARELRADARKTIEFLALNANQTGTHRNKMTSSKCRCKLAAMACHKSQFAMCDKNSTHPQGRIEIEGFAVDPQFWQHFSRYHPLIFDGETYDSL